MPNGAIFELISWQSKAVSQTMYLTVTACWIFFGVILVVGKRGAAPGARQSDRRSLVGMLLQGLACAICFAVFRDRFRPIFPMSEAAEAILGALTVALALWSTWFCYQAARTLGKQWALVARVIEGHELVRRGPYAIVRNPIYLAMFGMLIATGLAISRWQALVPAIAVYLIGTTVRIRSEESLLRATFGAQFDDYARRVPAFLPRL